MKRVNNAMLIVLTPFVALLYMRLSLMVRVPVSSYDRFARLV